MPLQAYRKTVSPIRTTSWSRSRCTVTRSPLMTVPFVEPLSTIQ